MRTCVLALTLICLAQIGQAGVIIDTASGWDGSSYIWDFGEPNTATYGQTITAPESVLTGFSLRLQHLSGAAVHFAGYVSAWDAVGGRATGSPLWQSTQQTLAAGAGWTTLQFDTGGVILTPGGMYVLYLSASNYFDGGSGIAAMALMGDVYSGGDFQFDNNGSDFAGLTTGRWDSFIPGDTAFTAEFEGGAVPEPSTWLLFGGGLVALGALARRRA